MSTCFEVLFVIARTTRLKTAEDYTNMSRKTRLNNEDYTPHSYSMRNFLVNDDCLVNDQRTRQHTFLIIMVLILKSQNITTITKYHREMAKLKLYQISPDNIKIS